MPAVARKKQPPPPIEYAAEPLPDVFQEAVRKPRKTLAEMAEGAEPMGLVCRACGCRDFRVVRVMHKVQGRIQRKRVCRHCGTPKITVEKEAFEK